MPRPHGRAARGPLFLALVLLLALPPAAGDGGFDPRAVVWSTGPILNGQVVVSCGETSPVKNVCGRHVPAESCTGATACGPDIAHGLGFTGVVTAIVWGKASNQRDDRHVRYDCPYHGGSQVGLPMAYRTGDCWGSSDAEVFCTPQCDMYMWPPFRLEGRAGSWQGLGPTGSWTAKVVAE